MCPKITITLFVPKYLKMSQFVPKSKIPFLAQNNFLSICQKNYFCPKIFFVPKFHFSNLSKILHFQIVKNSIFSICQKFHFFSICQKFHFFKLSKIPFFVPKYLSQVSQNEKKANVHKLFRFSLQDSCDVFFFLKIAHAWV